MSSLSSPPPSSFSSMLCLRKKRQRNNFFQCYYFMAILVCYITLFSSSNNNNNNNIVVFAQSTGGTSSETPKPGCGDWERTAKDEIARFKQAEIEHADKEAKLELRCVDKVNKIRGEKSKKISAMKKEVAELKSSSETLRDQLDKWKTRATRAENVLKNHVKKSEVKRKEITTQKADLEDQVEALKKKVTGWQAATSLVAKWAKEEHENRHEWLKKHADELGQLSSILKQEKLKFSNSYMEFIKTGFTKPEDFLKSLKSIYKDAKMKRSSREKVFSNHKEKEFQQSLKLLESEAPAGFLRGQGSLAPQQASSAQQDPASLFGLQSTSGTSNSALSYNNLPGSSMDRLGSNIGGGVNQWI